MAKAKDDLMELKDEDPVPTVREILADIGKNADKYETILDKSGPEMYWEKTYSPKNAVERGSLVLFAAAKQSGADPEEYLSRFGPYLDSKINALPKFHTASGWVNTSRPDIANISASARRVEGRVSDTIPHELEHTLQQLNKEDPYFQEVTKDSGRVVKRFGIWDQRYEDLQKRLDALPPEQRKEITEDHPVFGRYLRQGNELFARLRAREMLEAARGNDFYQTEMGQALLPDDKDKAYMVSSTLPGQASMTPPWSFEQTDNPPRRKETKDKSYARQVLEMLPKFQEGGTVSSDPWEMYLPKELPEEAFSDPRQTLEYQPLNVQALIDRGVIRVTQPGTGKEDGSYAMTLDPYNWSLVTAYNDQSPGSYTVNWPSKPESYPDVIQSLNQPGPLYDGKYRQILWSARQAGLRPEDVFLPKK